LLKATVLTLKGSSIEDEKPYSEEGDAALEVCNMVVVLPIRLAGEI